jgi:hypothetical protein
MFAAEAPPALRSFMAAPSEIEKLERRYAENPDGRFFAPLADAYRKAGTVDRALELVRAGLVKHPDYLSAHIVLGRCLLDKGDDAEAERTFRSVLELDGENIIALKSLAEITERTGRTLEARQWLQKLLVVDSMNVEAEADLQRLGGVIAQQATQEIEPVHTDAAEVSFADLAREMEPEGAPAPPVPPAPPAVESAPAPTPEPMVAAAPAAPVEATADLRLKAGADVPVETAAAPAAAAPADLPVAPVEAVAEPAPMAAPEAPAPPPAPAPEPQPEAAPEGFVSIAEVQAAPPDELPPAVPDRHPLPQELQVGESALELMPFDDSLAWGTGERSSRAIREEDIAAFAHDESLTTPAVEFIAGIEPTSETPAGPAAGQGAMVEPPPPSPAGEPAEFAVERQDDSPFFTTGDAPPPVPNVELPADLSGAYSIIDMPDLPPASAEPPLAPPPPAPEFAPPTGRVSGPPSGLPLIMPEDVTPAEELSRPSSKLVQMVSPAPPPEERGGQAEQPMLTETLGDLYLSQGFRSEAADVYRRLLTQRPGEEGLRAKLRALEAPPVDLSASALGAESVGAWLGRIAAARLRTAAAAAPAEPAPGPSPLEAAFAAPPAEPHGEAAYPANDAFSLDQIFGSPGENPAPAPGSTGTAPAPAPAPPQDVGASFDEFFGAPPDTTSVRPVAKAPDAPAQPGDEDLSAFNAWLQGLKR